MRIALGIEYDGSRFSGWETQARGRTVQNVVEIALAEIATSPIQTVCAGRTDSGVHAYGQVVHFDTSAERPETAWVLGTNTRLPGDVSIQWAKVVPDSFHARYSAVSRCYHYWIKEGYSRSALSRDRATFIPGVLNIQQMATASKSLVGEYDFSAFRSSRCQSRTPWRTIHSIDVFRYGEMVKIKVVANAFLQHMVRNLVGSLVEVGKGRKSPCWLKETLLSKDRRCAGPTMAPNGLYLIEVAYPTDFQIPRLSDNGFL